MATLVSKPGITNAAVLSIPTQWNAQWFQNFISSYLKGADVRNAIAGTGITITGNLTSPYATISATGSGGTPAGPTGAVQFNNSGSFGGNSGLLYTSGGIALGSPTGGSLANSINISGTYYVDGVEIPETASDSILLSAGNLTLVGDVATPGNLYFYGTNASGVRGWYLQSSIPTVGGASTTTIFTQSGGASQTYNKPSGANALRVIVVGGGGGGASGGRESVGSGADGGGGGGGGGVTLMDIPASAVGSTVTVTFSNVTTGGAGGAPFTGTAATGNAGTAGSSAQFGNFAIAYGGAGGSTSGGGAGGFGAEQTGTNGGSGGLANTGAGGIAQVSTSLAITNQAPTGGGGGGGQGAGSSQFAGGAGGTNASSNNYMVMSPGAAGAAGGGAGNIGTSTGYVGVGGGGGGGAISSTNGGTGGNGSNYGGGGGGGGACVSPATQSGAGGNGGPAAVVVFTW
jgi:hypothetical protein